MFRTGFAASRHGGLNDFNILKAVFLQGFQRFADGFYGNGGNDDSKGRNGVFFDDGTHVAAAAADKEAVGDELIGKILRGVPLQDGDVIQSETGDVLFAKLRGGGVLFDGADFAFVGQKPHFHGAGTAAGADFQNFGVGSELQFAHDQRPDFAFGHGHFIPKEAAVGETRGEVRPYPFAAGGILGNDDAEIAEIHGRDFFRRAADDPFIGVGEVFAYGEGELGENGIVQCFGDGGRGVFAAGENGGDFISRYGIF